MGKAQVWKPALMLAACVLFASWVRADTIFLKDGRTVEGAIVAENDETVEIEVNGRTRTYKQSEIAAIENIDEKAIVEDASKDDGDAASPFALRKKRAAAVKEFGGGVETEAAVEAALDWLARHQDEDGSWDVDYFVARCDKMRGEGCVGAGLTKECDVAVTSLALLAFLGAGYAPGDGSDFADEVDAGVEYLLSAQSKRMTCEITGEQEANERMYDHAMATAALCEAYALSGREDLQEPVRRALDFIIEAQNVHYTDKSKKYGWRYTPRCGMNDTSVTAWAVMALQSGRMCGFEVPEETFAGALLWLEDVTDPSGRISYMEKYKGSSIPAESAEKFWRMESCTAAGLTMRKFLGDTKLAPESAQLLAKAPPQWDMAGVQVDFYYWYFGTLAMYQVGGEQWEAWNKAVKKALLGKQAVKGCVEGSWDPVDKWGERGGRVYATALNALTLETYYRYRRVAK